MKLNRLLIAIFLLMQLSHCGDGASTKEATCTAPKPEAVFDANPSAILSHSFSLNGHNGKEELSFEDGSSLVLFQSGCEKIIQEFRFSFSEKLASPLTQIAIDRLMYLANIDDKYMSFANWAKAIESLEEQFSQQNNVEVEKGFYVGLDKIDSTSQTILMIKLYQK